MILEREFNQELRFKPVTMKEWDDLQQLFGKNGASNGCWCMWWRIKRSEFEKQQGEGNRRALKKIIETGEVPGILAYIENRPVGWCSIAPREHFPVLDRSRTLKRVDSEPVWSIVCFFIEKPFRGRGLTLRLIKGAVEYAKSRGAKIVEAYPLNAEKTKDPTVEGYTGFVTTFQKAGFREIIRRSERRSLMRYFIGLRSGR